MPLYETYETKRRTAGARSLLHDCSGSPGPRCEPGHLVRWIDAGRLPAYRVGPRKIRKREDLARMTTPARAFREEVSPVHATIYASGSVAIPSLTDEERKRGRQALAEIRALREQLAAHGEKEPAGS